MNGLNIFKKSVIGMAAMGLMALATIGSSGLAYADGGKEGGALPQAQSDQEVNELTSALPIPPPPPLDEITPGNQVPLPPPLDIGIGEDDNATKGLSDPEKAGCKVAGGVAGEFWDSGNVGDIADGVCSLIYIY